MQWTRFCFLKGTVNLGERDNSWSGVYRAPSFASYVPRLSYSVLCLKGRVDWARETDRLGYTVHHLLHHMCLGCHTIIVRNPISLHRQTTVFHDERVAVRMGEGEGGGAMYVICVLLALWAGSIF